MKKNILLATIIIVSIMGLAIYSQNSVPFVKEPTIIWENNRTAEERDELRAAIELVELSVEECNKVTLNVDYNNLKNKTDGYFRITASHMADDKNYKGFRGDHSITILKNKGQVIYSNWITSERQSANTNELWVSIEEIVDKRFKSVVDRVKIKYSKRWEHSCSE
jgi:hypothetical protein